MTRYLAFLRGVNLGKRQTKSADLKAVFESLGYAGVKTLITSGNVLFETGAPKGLKAGSRRRSRITLVSRSASCCARSTSLRR